MTRWLLAAKAAQPPFDTIDTTDKNAPDGLKSVLSIKSEGGKPLFHGVPVGLPEHAGRPISEADFNQWVEFEERAAVLEFNGGHSRQDAEQLARLEVYGEGGDG